VRKATRHNIPEKDFAVKSLARAQVETDIDDIEQELLILRETDSPYIVKLYEVFVDTKYLHLVMEYLPGGDVDSLL
jgi:serine/threonine protein kinase